MRLSNKIISQFIGPAFIAAASFVGCEMPGGREVQAVVLELEGSAFLSDASGARILPLQRGSRVPKGSRLRTNGKADLLLLPGASLHAEENSEIVFREIRLRKNGNARSDAMRRIIHLDLVAGEIFVLVQFAPSADGCLIETPHGKIRIDQPAAFTLEVGAERTRLTVLRGSADFEPENADPRQSVQAGYFEEWPSAESVPIPAESEAKAQGIIENSIGLERKLLNQQDRRRVAPFPWRQHEF